jgi:hypothetical protein
MMKASSLPVVQAVFAEERMFSYDLKEDTRADR